MSDRQHRVVVAGGRDFNNYKLLEKKLDYFFSNIDKDDLEIVCGRARGADNLGEEYAEDREIRVEPFPANWDKHGKAAGYIRNEEMAKYCTHVVVFWDGVSKGSKSMIELAKKYDRPLRIVKY